MMETMALILGGLLLSILMTMLIHWFPWRPLFGKDLSRIYYYIIGTAVNLVPPSAFLLLWIQERREYFVNSLLVVGLYWVFALAVGITTLIVNALDTFLETRARMRSAEDDGQVFRRRLTDEQDTGSDRESA